MIFDAIYEGMVKNSKLHLTTILALTISIILCVVIPKDETAEIAFVSLILFSVSAILLSASLTWFAKRSVRNNLHNIPLALLFGVVSWFIYYRLVLFAFSDIMRGESAIFIAIFGVLGGIVVGIISILINLLILVDWKKS